MPNPSNSDKDGFYSPDELPFQALPNYQEMVNRLKPTLSVQIRDGIDNLVNMLPGVYAEQQYLGSENVVWLRRKTSGVPCPNGVNTIDFEEQCGVSKCPICFNTTFVGGYDAPVKLQMSFNPQKVETGFEGAGLVIQERPTAWTIDTDPIFKPMDLVVTYANERYLVETQESEEVKGRRMYQRLTLNRLDKWDVAYAVPVPTIYGDAYTDFIAKLEIVGLKQDFLATITINNYYWSETGRNNVPLPIR